MELCDEAWELAFSLDHGLIEVADAVRWSDARLLARDDTPEALVDISLAGSLPADEVARLLRRVPGAHDVQHTARRVLARMATALDAGRVTPERIARSLYAMYLDGQVPEPAAESDMMRLDDAFDLARSGTLGTLADAERELREFLGRYR